MLHGKLQSMSRQTRCRQYERIIHEILNEFWNGPFWNSLVPSARERIVTGAIAQPALLRGGALPPPLCLRSARGRVCLKQLRERARHHRAAQGPAMRTAVRRSYVMARCYSAGPRVGQCRNPKRL